MLCWRGAGRVSALAAPGPGARRQDQQSGRRFRRPRQDHRPHHFVRGRDQRDGAVRRAADHAARLLFPPADRAPQTDAFAQVDEIDEQKQIKRIFSGWMFADSPGLHGVEHPIFDIWLTACKGGTVVIHDAPTAEASAPNPDESPPTDAGGRSGLPRAAGPAAAIRKRKSPSPPQPSSRRRIPALRAPFDPAPNQSPMATRARADPWPSQRSWR